MLTDEEKWALKEMFGCGCCSDSEDAKKMMGWEDEMFSPSITQFVEFLLEKHMKQMG